ncbi:MAG: hypothetical protein MUE48_09515 [Desulfobacterales bacterium]|nr:hypothetical protein [Desulfobacterales bacterium]
MTRCPLHPEVETRLQCAKHGTFVCPRCLACRDPELYQVGEGKGRAVGQGARLFGRHSIHGNT